MVNMMSNDKNCFVCGKKGHIGHHYPQAQCYSCDDFCNFTQDCLKKIAPSGKSYYHNRSHSHSQHNHSCRDRAHSFHHRQTKETALTGQDHTINPSATEAPVTTGCMHPALYLITTSVLITPLQTGTLEEPTAGIPHTTTGPTHLDTHYTRATNDTT